MRWCVSAVMRSLLLAVVWISLAGWDADYAVYGLISVAAAAVLSLALLPPGRTRPRHGPRRLWFTTVLVGWFLWKSVVGGIDVALRALKPGPDIEPAVIPAPLRLPSGHARQTALLMMNLMPGSMVQRVVTASGETADDPETPPVSVELHTLSPALRPAEQWSTLQRRVGSAFGLDS